MSYQTICCVGDSIANGYWCDQGLGWFGRLQTKIATAYPKQFGFNNLAQSGDRTHDTYHRICTEVVSRKPDILIIAVGINDIIRWLAPDAVTDQSPAACEIAWQKVLDVAKRNVSKILVVGLIPVVEERFPNPAYEDKIWHFNQDVREYNQKIAAWCNTAGIPFLDIFETWLQQDYISLFEDDSHPNGAGHALLCEQVFDKIKNLDWVK